MAALEFVEFGDYLLLRLVDQNAVAHMRRILHAQKVRVATFEVAVFEVRKLPLAFAECVVAVGVLLEQRNGDFLPKSYLLEGVRNQFFCGYLQAIPALVAEQSLDFRP